MNIIISNANNEPIYEQIYSQIKSAIISSELKGSAPVHSKSCKRFEN